VRTHQLGFLSRTVLSATAASVLGFLAAAGPVRAEAGDGLTATGATIDRLGWWHEKNVATETPAGPVTVPAPPGVPAGTVSVGAINGEPDRIAALGIAPDALAGDTATQFTLTLTEAEAPAVQANSAAAAISACPITEFWVPVENGTWANRPVYDCELASVPGTRANDGTWTFDLLPIAQLWLDPAGTVVADGIVLVEDVETPSAFQVVFATEGDGAGAVRFEATPGAPTTDTTLPPVDPGFSSDPGSFDLPDVGAGDVPVGDLPPVAAPTTAAPTTAAPVATGPLATTSPNVLGNLPGGLVVAVPAFLVLMALLSFTLGPAGEPVAATRQGGVSRALAARSLSRTPPSEDR
jgi:hypothetical protein